MKIFAKDYFRLQSQITFFSIMTMNSFKMVTEAILRVYAAYSSFTIYNVQNVFFCQTYTDFGLASLVTL